MIEKINQKIILLEKILKHLYRIYFDEKSCIENLGNVIQYYVGGTFKSEDYTNVPSNKLITIKNINESGFNLDDITYFTMKPEYKKYKLDVGDVLLTMTGAYLGRTGIVDCTNCYLNQRILKIVCNSRSLVYIYLKLNEKNIFNLGRGSAQPNLSVVDFLNIKVPFTKKNIKDFQKYDSVFDMILKSKILTRKLTHLKKLLLSKYF